MKRTPFEERAAGTIVIVMVIMVAVQVACRYVLHLSLSHTEELVRYLFVWATFLGASAAVRSRSHLTVFSGGKNRPARLRRAAKFAAAAASLLYTGVLSVWGARVVTLEYTTGQTTAALGLPMWIVGLAVPAGAILIAVRIVRLPADRKGEP